MRHSKMVAVTTAKIKKSTNKWIGKLLLPLIVVCIVFGASPQLAQAKAQKTGVHNYLGTDGNWHYVTTYKDSETGAEWSSEWRNGNGPHVHIPKKLPYWGITESENSNSSNIGILDGNKLAFEFMASTSGVIEVKVAEDVEIEIINLEDGSIFFQKMLYGQPYLQDVVVSSGFYTYKPYCIVVYKDKIPSYMELFLFDGTTHNSMELYSSPGYDVEYPPAGYELEP